MTAAIIRLPYQTELQMLHGIYSFIPQYSLKTLVLFLISILEWAKTPVLEITKFLS